VLYLKVHADCPDSTFVSSTPMMRARWKYLVANTFWSLFKQQLRTLLLMGIVRANKFESDRPRIGMGDLFVRASDRPRADAHLSINAFCSSCRRRTIDWQFSISCIRRWIFHRMLAGVLGTSGTSGSRVGTPSTMRDSFSLYVHVLCHIGSSDLHDGGGAALATLRFAISNARSPNVTICLRVR
jgi:hypothetical protein